MKRRILSLCIPLGSVANPSEMRYPVGVETVVAKRSALFGKLQTQLSHHSSSTAAGVHAKSCQEYTGTPCNKGD